MATISKFREFPKTKTVWQAFWLGLVSILIWPIAAFIVSMRPVMTKAIGVGAGPAVGIGLVVIFAILTILALIVSVGAFKKGERSWILWVGFIAAVLNALFMLIMTVAG